MKIQNKYTLDEQEISFDHWENAIPNKESYQILDWGDLVMWQLFSKEGNKQDHKLIERDHVIRIIKLDEKRNAFRELSRQEEGILKSTYSLSSKINKKFKFIILKKFLLNNLSIILAIATIFISTIVALFGDNLWDRISNINYNHFNSDTLQVSKSDDNYIQAITKLPLNENVGLLDKCIFIRAEQQFIKLGGVNIDTISINLRGKNGENIQPFSFYGNIRFSHQYEPYIEFEYKGKYYSIDVLKKSVLTFIKLDTILNPSLKLIPYKGLTKATNRAY